MTKENQLQLKAELAMMKPFLGSQYFITEAIKPSESNRATNEHVIYLKKIEFIFPELDKAFVDYNIILILFLDRFLSF